MNVLFCYYPRRMTYMNFIILLMWNFFLNEANKNSYSKVLLRYYPFGCPSSTVYLHLARDKQRSRKKVSYIVLYNPSINILEIHASKLSSKASSVKCQRKTIQIKYLMTNTSPKPCSLLKCHLEGRNRPLTLHQFIQDPMLSRDLNSFK